MTKDQCRICLGNGIVKSIFLKEGQVTISTKIMCIAKIHIYPGDGLPNTICPECINKLNSCYEFIDLCKVSDLKLRANFKIQVDSFSSKSEKLNDENLNNQSYEVNNIGIKLEHDKTNNCGALVKDGIVKKKEKDEASSNIKNKTKIDNFERKIVKQQCFTCGKVMSSKFRLKTHLRTHTGERPFSCPHCNKNFSLAQNLKVHLRTHTGEKPLRCTICGESFAQTAGLAAHKRKHTGQTPYRCVWCPRSFRTIGHLQYHIRRHTGEKNFECDTCGKAFITRSDLKQHISTHTGDRPHVCNICGQRLSRASHLKRHILHMHNRLKRLDCSECSITFTNKTEFEKHGRQHSEKLENMSETQVHGGVDFDKTNN